MDPPSATKSADVPSEYVLLQLSHSSGKRKQLPCLIIDIYQCWIATTVEDLLLQTRVLSGIP
jgi:hypothetical protein